MTESKTIQPFYVAVHGTSSQASGWLQLLRQEGVPYRLRAEPDPNALICIYPAGVSGSLAVSGIKAAIYEDRMPSGASDFGVAYSKGFQTQDLGWINAPGSYRLTEGPDLGLGRICPFEIPHDDLLSFPVVLQDGGNLYLAAPLSRMLAHQGAIFRELADVSVPGLQFCANPVDKARLLLALRAVLRHAFALAGLPYFHLWYFPEGAPSILLFRQDVDYVHPVGLQNLLDATSQYGIRGTFFVNLSGEEEVEDDIGQGTLVNSLTLQRVPYLRQVAAHHEIASHGYWHKVFADYGRNLEDLLHANELLERTLGIRVRGYASPGGSWHHQLALAVSAAGFQYCSCSTYQDTGLPQFLDLGPETGELIHIPSWPVHFPEFNEYDLKVEELGQIYLRFARRQIAHHQPITITGHPHIDGPVAAELYEPLFRLKAESNLPSMTLGDYADWWRRRSRTEYSVHVISGSLVVRSADRIQLVVDQTLHRLEAGETTFDRLQTQCQ